MSKYADPRSPSCEQHLALWRSGIARLTTEDRIDAVDEEVMSAAHWVTSKHLGRCTWSLPEFRAALRAVIRDFDSYYLDADPAAKAQASDLGFGPDNEFVRRVAERVLFDW